MNLSVRHEASLRGYDLSLCYKGNENLVLGDYGTKARRFFDEERIQGGHYMELMRKIGYGENKDNSWCGCSHSPFKSRKDFFASNDTAGI